jgi:uncharacterized protein (TIGR03067 family)
MRTLALALTATALALAAHGAPAPLPKPDPGKEDLKRMQGRWDIVSEESGAGTTPREPGTQIVVAGRRLKFVHGGRVVIEWDCTLDPRKEPKHLTMKGIGVSAPYTLLAVYELKGDTFTFCNDNARGKRPAGLAKVGPGDIRYVLKRVKR